MSVQDILQHAIEKNPLEMKEALEAEMQGRVRLAIEEKMAAALEEAADEDESDDEDEDEDDDMDESFDLSDYTVEELEDFMETAEIDQLDELSPDLTKRYMQKASSSMRDMKAKSKAHRTLGNDSEADRLKDKVKNRELGFDKAAARNFASRGVHKKDRRPATNKDMIHKAAQKMPSSYYKEYYDLEEQTMTVDIDHMGGRDAMAKKHNITLKKTGDTTHDATGKKKDLQKYLVHHYGGDHEDAKGNHPEVYK